MAFADCRRSAAGDCACPGACATASAMTRGNSAIRILPYIKPPLDDWFALDRSRKALLPGRSKKCKSFSLPGIDEGPAGGPGNPGRVDFRKEATGSYGVRHLVSYLVFTSLANTDTFLKPILLA